MLDVPPGLPLGVGGEPFEEVEVELPEGALLALYTDGLVESRDHPLDEGLQAFVGALTDLAHAPAHRAETHRDLEDVCDRVLNTLDSHHGEDDIALLMARVQGLPADSVGDWTLPREPRSVGRAREYARAQLLSWTWSRWSTSPNSWSANWHQRPAVRRGRDPAAAAARLDPGLRGLGLRPGPAAPPPRPRHRRGRTGTATGRPAQRGLGVPAHPARQDGLVRTAAARRRDRPDRPGGGPAEPVLTPERNRNTRTRRPRRHRRRPTRRRHG
ncbi:hypothetical protein SFUMM280S_04521 [Streptomyces fumanus]